MTERSTLTGTIATPRRSTSGRRVLQVLLGLVPLVVFLGVWQVIADPDDPRFPPPSQWAVALGELQDKGLLGPALLSTTVSFFVALFFSIVLGALLGLVIGASRKAEDALGPTLEILRITPPPAIIPIVVLLIGTTTATTVIVVVFAAMWPIVFNTAAAVRAIPPVRVEMAQSLGLTRFDQTLKVVAPSLVPGLALGVRIAAPLCLIVVLVAEMLTSTSGVGQLLIERQRAYDAASVFGLVAVVGVIGLTVNIAVSLLEASLAKSFGNAPRR